jgi:hypothetical protein
MEAVILLFAWALEGIKDKSGQPDPFFAFGK